MSAHLQSDIEIIIIRNYYFAHFGKICMYVCMYMYVCNQTLQAIKYFSFITLPHVGRECNTLFVFVRACYLLKLDI